MSGISPQQKEGYSQKGARIEKKKRWNLISKVPCFKRRKGTEDEIYKLLGEILSKERKEITFSYSAKSDVWPHPYPHIISICTTFYSLTFSFLTCSTLIFARK
jgi:hypothetical protein